MAQLHLTYPITLTESRSDPEMLMPWQALAGHLRIRILDLVMCTQLLHINMLLVLVMTHWDLVGLEVLTQVISTAKFTGQMSGYGN